MGSSRRIAASGSASPGLQTTSTCALLYFLFILESVFVTVFESAFTSLFASGSAYLIYDLLYLQCVVFVKHLFQEASSREESFETFLALHIFV